MKHQDKAATVNGQKDIQLSQEHHLAVNRRRRVVVQYDPNFEIGLDLAQRSENQSRRNFVGHTELTDQSLFVYEDDPDTQIDVIIWDMGGPSTLATWPSKVLEPFRHEALVKWWDKGLDPVTALVDACHERGLEAFWNFRISEADFLPDLGASNKRVAIKEAHPDWIIKDIHWYGEWNYAVPEVRKFNLEILRELAHNYDFDGIQIDFSRHMPILPPGEGWEFREELTKFVRMVRLMTLEVEQKRGRPFLLGVKIPRNLEGCRADGIDVETWAGQNLVDILTVGARSMDVDIAAFRRITAGRNIKLHPSLDSHHATAGYKWPPIEFYRGVFGNWWRQRADSVQTFNWSTAVQQGKEKYPSRYAGTRVELQAYKEIGDPGTLAGKNKFFAIERRGGFSWSGGFFCRNDTAPLPETLTNYGKPANLSIRICDDLSALPDKIEQVILRVILTGAREGDQLEVRFNGTLLSPVISNYDCKDSQLHSSQPQPNMCTLGVPEVERQQELLRLDCLVSPSLCEPGENHVSLRIADRIPYKTGHDITLEKCEIHVAYK